MMKKHPVISVLTVALLVLLGWLLYFFRVAPVGEGTTTINEERRQQDGLDNNSEKTFTENRRIAEPTLIEQLRGIADLANRPIEFYGKVVDQDNASIPGVKVTLQIRAMKEGTPGVVADLFEDIVVISDTGGRFMLTDEKGSVLTVKSLEKAGYDPSSKSTNQSYRYWDNENVRYKADVDRPEIFRMWKKGGAAPLEHAKKFYGIVPDGRSYTIDVIAHKKTEGGSAGDFKVSIQRPAQITARDKYDWCYIIEAIGGGLIQSDAEQMYFAPEAGYQQRYEIMHVATDPEWAERDKRQFYLQSRGGRVYARLEVEILSNYRNQAIFSVEYYANPSGSRNLEYDPLQGVRMSPALSK